MNVTCGKNILPLKSPMYYKTVVLKYFSIVMAFLKLWHSKTMVFK
jgi:hypothetical protein